MIIFEYRPDEEGYTPLKMEIDMPNDSDIYKHFEAWKSFMHAITFSSMENYDLIDITEESEINDTI